MLAIKILHLHKLKNIFCNTKSVFSKVWFLITLIPIMNWVSYIWWWHHTTFVPVFKNWAETSNQWPVWQGWWIWTGSLESHSVSIVTYACLFSNNCHPHFTTTNKCVQNGFNVLHGKHYLVNSLFIGIFPNINNEISELSLSWNPIFSFIHRNLKHCGHGISTNSDSNPWFAVPGSSNQTTD